MLHAPYGVQYIRSGLYKGIIMYLLHSIDTDIPISMSMPSQLGIGTSLRVHELQFDSS